MNPLHEVVLALCFLAKGEVVCGEIAIKPPMPKTECEVVVGQLNQRMAPGKIGDASKDVIIGQAQCKPSGDPA